MAKTYLEGHNDIVVNSAKIAWMSYLNNREENNIEPELRVCTWNNPPFVYAQRSHNDNFDNEFFSVSGPLYSLIKEAALKMNSRLDF